MIEFWFPIFKPAAGPVVGVSGKELADVGGESRRTALDSGRKMPAPGTVVVK